MDWVLAWDMFRHVTESKWNLKPFFKPKLKPNFSQLNCHPGPHWCPRRSTTSASCAERHCKQMSCMWAITFMTSTKKWLSRITARWMVCGRRVVEVELDSKKLPSNKTALLKIAGKSKFWFEISAFKVPMVTQIRQNLSCHGQREAKWFDANQQLSFYATVYQSIHCTAMGIKIHPRKI